MGSIESRGPGRDLPPRTPGPRPLPETAIAFLEEVKASGYALPRAPIEATWNPRLIDVRRGHFTHPPSIEMQYACYRCLSAPDVAYVAETRDGWVWLDLCHDCSLWMLRGIRKLGL